MTKIDIFSGFLGAGKTTLIKKLITEAYTGEKLVLIENEFGETGIDGGFLKESGIQINEMNSGCICCSLVGDFADALSKVIGEFHPDRILIEPSGVGKLSDVIKAVLGAEGTDAAVNAAVTVVDAGKCKMYIKNFGEFFLNQVENAHTIILSRTSGISQDKLDTCVKLIREHNGHAALITTPWDELDGKKILEAMENNVTLEQELAELMHEHEHEHEHECGCDHHHEHHDHDHDHDHDHGCEHHHEHECEHEHEHGEECSCGCHGHGHDQAHHHADEVFSSWGTETARKFKWEDIENALKALEDEKTYGYVLRAKGIVALDDGTWAHFDYVPGEADIRHGSSDITGKICVIGSKLATDKLLKLFGL